MAEDKVRVKTNDGEILEVDLDVAKQWGPINNMYESKFLYQRISIESHFLFISSFRYY
jgi:hypothetical protein